MLLKGANTFGVGANVAYTHPGYGTQVHQGALGVTAYPYNDVVLECHDRRGINRLDDPDIAVLVIDLPAHVDSHLQGAIEGLVYGHCGEQGLQVRVGLLLLADGFGVQRQCVGGGASLLFSRREYRGIADVGGNVMYGGIIAAAGEQRKQQ